MNIRAWPPFLFFLLVATRPLSCLAADHGPLPIELDTRDEKALLEDVHSKMLIGNWFSFKDGLATIKITKTLIQEAGCSSPYTVVQKSVGRSYPDEIPSRETGKTGLEVGRFVTVKIHIKNKVCSGSQLGGFLQFSFMTTDPDFSFASIVEYDESDRPIAWYDLRKR